jgi:hypothetical protein
MVKKSPRPETVEERRALIWAKAQIRIAEFDRIRNHPRRLHALYLIHARSARFWMSIDVDPGRWWYRRQHNAAMRKIKALNVR